VPLALATHTPDAKALDLTIFPQQFLPSACYSKTLDLLSSYVEVSKCQQALKVA
jgi:hypothetical protein